MDRLIYLSHIQLDLTYAVGVVSRFMHDPKKEHYKLYIGLRYLKATPSQRILFRGGNSVMIEAYTDTDYARSLIDKKINHRYCIFLGGNLVIWTSEKQPVVTRTSAETEYQVMGYGIYELLRLRIALKDLKIKTVLSSLLLTTNHRSALPTIQFNIIAPKILRLTEIS